jgi:D-3-phosphoglycerate dehydrogenase
MSNLKKDYQVLVLENFSYTKTTYKSADLILNLNYQAELDESKIKCEAIDAVVVRSKTKVNLAFLNLFSKLRIIITCTSGFDHIDLKSCKEKNVVVIYTPNSNATSAAELTWSLLLSQTKNLQAVLHNTQNFRWRQENLRSCVLSNKTLGVVGLGRIGHRVAQYGMAFGMNVVYYDPYVDHKNNIKLQSFNLQKVDYISLLKNSDFISFHVPKTDETTEMLNYKNISCLKTHCGIINTSRASVFSNKILLDFIESNPESKLSLDVHDIEPIPKNYIFLNHPRIQLTAHIGAHTREAIENSTNEALEKLVRFFSNLDVEDQLA